MQDPPDVKGKMVLLAFFGRRINKNISIITIVYTHTYIQTYEKPIAPKWNVYFRPWTKECSQAPIVPFPRLLHHQVTVCHSGGLN